MTVAVVGRERIEHDGGASLLPLLTEQVPGLFTTGRGVLGYGVSGGAAGQMSLRGIGGPAQAASRCWPSAWRWCAAPPRCSTAQTPWAA